MSSAGGGAGDAYLKATQGDVTLTTTGTVTGAGVIGNDGIGLVKSGLINANTAAGLGEIAPNSSCCTTIDL